jgi:hypothetical protein
LVALCIEIDSFFNYTNFNKVIFLGIFLGFNHILIYYIIIFISFLHFPVSRFKVIIVNSGCFNLILDLYHSTEIGHTSLLFLTHYGIFVVYSIVFKDFAKFRMTCLLYLLPLCSPLYVFHSPLTELCRPIRGLIPNTSLSKRKEPMYLVLTI